MLMKNIQFSSPETDREVLLILRKAVFVSLCLGVPALVGFLLPSPFSDPGIRFIDALFSASLGVFAWGIFGIISPGWLNRDWMIAKIAAIPLGWLCFVLALAVWFSHLRSIEGEFTESLKAALSSLYHQ